MATRRTPQQRLNGTINHVAAVTVASYSPAELRGLDIDPSWPDQLAEAERSIRRLRELLEALIEESPRTCARCREPMGGRADRKFCTDRCRIAEHRSRHTTRKIPEEALPPSRRRGTG